MGSLTETRGCIRFSMNNLASGITTPSAHCPGSDFQNNLPLSKLLRSFPFGFEKLENTGKIQKFKHPVDIRMDARHLDVALVFPDFLDASHQIPHAGAGNIG